MMRREAHRAGDGGIALCLFVPTPRLIACITEWASPRIVTVRVLAKHFLGDRWRSLSVPRGGSGGFTEKVQRGEASQR